MSSAFRSKGERDVWLAAFATTKATSAGNATDYATDSALRAHSAVKRLRLAELDEDDPEEARLMLAEMKDGER